eukprot:TRINITY_DN1388_c0_g1_i1.p1 TRINITY_DN1388_c0_g1~~TRINITY_DN1388_c0_g1_i1.p1  ORF type:complete len:950 (-),score=248.13 TRINITY_DN1388_c0_g1_i1:318-3167(-)
MSSKSDIRKWFMKQPHKSNEVEDTKFKQGDETGKHAAKKNERKPLASDIDNTKEKPQPKASPEKEMKSSKKPPLKRKAKNSNEETASNIDEPKTKKPHAESQKSAEKSKESHDDVATVSDDEAVFSVEKSVSNRSGGQGGGRGRGRGAGNTGGGRGSGGGRGIYGNFGERGPPPHKGQKEVPVGAENCLSGLTFVISGTLDSLEREEAEDLIKSYGGRVTGSVSKKTSYLLADEDIGGRKSQKAKELGVQFLTEDGLFEMIRKSKPANPDLSKDAKQTDEKDSKVNQKINIVQNSKTKGHQKATEKYGKEDDTNKISGAFERESLTWTEKYRPKSPNDIIGNQSIVNQLRDWLAHWEEQHLHAAGKINKGKRKGTNVYSSSNSSKKAVLISGPPGIGKTTSARLASQMLGFETIEVNASDSRGKADSKIERGIGGSTSNSIKEMVSNESLSRRFANGFNFKKAVLIMDEVDGMSGGDRGGIADLISSIKTSKLPIICICNDRYNQKLKSLTNYCLLLNFRKPTKQQMAKRLSQIAKSEGLHVDESALEELGERVNGDMRMAVNQLQYMSLSLSVIKYADIKARLTNGEKDEDITPFAAVDKLLGYDGGKLRMDERMELCMSDPDLVPLFIQENYLNYRPSIASNDGDGSLRMDLISRAAESIADGDIINKQIRRYQQWQHSQMSAFASSIIPASLVHGRREVLVEGERNFNRFGAWLGKNSSLGKNTRLLADVHVHVLASRACELTREALRLDYLSLLLLKLISPLQRLPKEEAVQSVVHFMDEYSLSQEDLDTMVELSKFQGHPDPYAAVPAAVKSALTKACKQSGGRVRSADLIPTIVVPGQKKAPKSKRVMSLLTAPEDEYPLNNEEDYAEEKEGSGNEDDLEAADAKHGSVKLSLEENKPQGVELQLEIKGREDSASKRVKRTQSKPLNEKPKPNTGAKGGKRKR